MSEAAKKLDRLIRYLSTATNSPGESNRTSDDFIYGYKMGVHDHNMAVVDRLRPILKTIKEEMK